MDNFIYIFCILFVMDLDLKDRKILFELEQDSRQSLAQIAKKVAHIWNNLYGTGTAIP